MKIKNLIPFSAFLLLTFSVFIVGCEGDVNDDNPLSNSFVSFAQDQYVEVEIGTTAIVDVDVYASSSTGTDRTFDLNYSGTADPSGYDGPSSVTIPAGETMATVQVGLVGGLFTVNGSTIVLEMNQSSDNDQPTTYSGSSEAGTLEVQYDTHTIYASDLCLANLVNLSIVFDNYPEETAWQMLLDGTVIDSGGIAGGAFSGEYAGMTEFSKTWCLDSGSYSFVMYDQYSDGICCTYGNGSYSLTLSDGTVLASGGDFLANEATDFTL